MTAYWLLYAIPAVLALMSRFADSKTSPIVWLSVAGVFAAVIGFRHEIGGDWRAYIVVFDNVSSMSLLSALQAFDTDYAVYVAINWAVASSGLTVNWVNLVCGSLFVFGLVVFCREQTNPWLALAVATPYLVVVIGMGFTRQSVAIAFELLALTALMDERWRRALVMILIAAAFHKSAIWLLALYVFAHPAMGARAIGLPLLLGVAIGFLFFPSDPAMVWEKYVATPMVSDGAWIRSIMNAVPAVMLLLLSKRLLSSAKQRCVWMPLAILAIGSLLLVPVASTLIDRLGFYLIPLQLFVFSRLPSLYSGTTVRSAVEIGIVVLYGVVLWVWLNYSVHSPYWVPYKMFLPGLM
jgi:hypothetical protein